MKAAAFQLKLLPPDVLWTPHLHQSPSSTLGPPFIRLLNKLFLGHLLMLGPLSKTDTGPCPPGADILVRKTDINQTEINNYKLRPMLSRGGQRKRRMAACGGLTPERWARPLRSLASKLDYKPPHKHEHPQGERPRIIWLGGSQSLQAPGAGYPKYLLNKQMSESAGYPVLFLMLHIFQPFQVHGSHLKSPSSPQHREQL